MKPPDPFVLFIDRSLGKQIIATALRSAGFQVEVHDNHFSPDAKDQEWLTEVGRKGWIVLTKDKKIKHRALFTLAAGGVQGSEMAQIFVKAMPKIRSYVDANVPPYIIRVTRSAHLARIYP